MNTQNHTTFDMMLPFTVKMVNMGVFYLHIERPQNIFCIHLEMAFGSPVLTMFSCVSGSLAAKCTSYLLPLAVSCLVLGRYQIQM